MAHKMIMVMKSGENFILSVMNIKSQHLTLMGLFQTLSIREELVNVLYISWLGI